MELPHLGKQCGISDCNQLDFLPFECDLCKGIYCKEHMSPLQHECSQYKDNVLLEKPTTTSIISYKCTECSALDQVEMLCEHCARHFCVAHRFHNCHQVETSRRKQLREQWKVPKEQFKQAKLAADKQIEAKLSRAEIAPESRPLALKLRLMKLKAKAAGDHRVPPVDRIYFNCVSPKHQASSENSTSGGKQASVPHNPSSTTQIPCKPVYVSRFWSVGKCLDTIAAQLKVFNDNKTGGPAKLRLYKQDGTRVDKGDLSVILDVLLKEERVYSGENLILERGDVERLSGELDYNFVV